jgi:hypothetical protein
MNLLELSYEEILRERAKILIGASKDPNWQAALKEMCKQEPVFFFDFFCYTKDPNKKPANLPFITYPYEKNLIYWLEDRLNTKNDGLIDKSRQMGVTWMIMTWLLYHWLFSPDFIAIVGSRKEELVDKRDKDDTLFYKLDYNLNRLPAWMMPKGFNSVKDRRHLLLVNQHNRSTIIGESSNKDFARGATASVIFLDEFAAWPEASASWDACSESARTKIVISTPAPATFFKTLRFSRQMQGKVKTVHWRMHPEKDEAWYEKMKENLSDETLAQEVDISYDVSGRGRVYPEFESVPIAHYEYNPKLPLYTASDYGLDTTATVWAQQNEDGDVYIIDSYQNEAQTIDFYIPFFTGRVDPKDKLKYTTDELHKIQEHSHWKPARNFGDPAGKQRTVTTDTTVLKILSQAGIHTFTNDRATSFPARKEATKILMRRLFVDEKNKAFIEAIRQSRYPQRREASQATSEISKPVHDWASHMRSALEYLAVNLKLVGGPARKVNYLDKKIRSSEDGKLPEARREIEKKKGILRWTFRSYK